MELPVSTSLENSVIHRDGLLESVSTTDIELNFAMYSFLCATLHLNQTAAGTARCAAIFDNSYWSLEPMTANVSSSYCSGVPLQRCFFEF